MPGPGVDVGRRQWGVGGSGVPRVVTREDFGASLRGASDAGWLGGSGNLALGGVCWRRAGDAAPPTVCPREGRRREPAPHPALGPPSPRGGRQGCRGGIHPLPGKGGSGRPRRVGAPLPYGWGIWKRPRGLRGHPFPDRRHGRGRACPARGLRGHPSMVRPVGEGS